MLGALCYKLFEGAGARVHFVRSKWTYKSGHSVIPKLDTFAVPLEAKIELWLQREVHSQFSVRRLEIAQIYSSEDPQRPLKVIRPLFLKGLERSCRQLPGLMWIRHGAKEGAYLKGHKRTATLCCAFRHPPQ